jgi:hypothetical protein
MPGTLYPLPGAVAAAAMVNVEDEVPPAEIVVGLKEQVKPAGAVQVSEI